MDNESEQCTCPLFHNMKVDNVPVPSSTKNLSPKEWDRFFKNEIRKVSQRNRPH